MIALKDYILESRGADIASRTSDRFFGDKLNRDRGVKVNATKVKQALDVLKDHLSADEMDMLKELADNNMYTGDQRSSLSVVTNLDALHSRKKKAYYYFECDFKLCMFNMPKSVINRLDDEVIKKNIKLEGKFVRCSTNLNTFGNDYTLTIRHSTEIELDEDLDAKLDKTAEFMKYVLDVIKPVYKDIISYRSENRDEQEIRQRNK